MTEALKPRQRNTSATHRRVENLRKLIEKMESTPMTNGDVADMFNFSATGSRKYLRDLREAGVVELSHREGITHDFIGTPVWKLTDDLEARKAFFENRAVTRKDISAPKREKNYYGKDPTRHFHVMADDVHYAIRINSTPCQRDPLVAALFGPAPTKT